MFKLLRPQHRILASSCLILIMMVGCAEQDTTEARLELVKASMIRADYGAASLELANLIQAQPKNLEARLLQGKVSLAAGRSRAAEAQFKQAKQLGADESAVLAPLSKSIIAQGEFGRLAQILGARPNEPKASIAWSIANGTAARYLGKPQLAQKYYQEALDLDPDNLDGEIGMAHLLNATGETARAERLFVQATQDHPLSIAAWQALGAHYFAQDRHLDAERAFINAIEGTDGIDRADEYMMARAGLIETQWWLDKKRLSDQNSKELIDSYPWHPLPKYLRGLLAFLNEDYTTAGDHLQRVIDVSPNHTPSLKMLAAINAAQGKLGRAQALLNQYFKLNPNDPEMIRLLAETFLSMGNADQALATLQPIMTKRQQDPRVLELYGTACRFSSSCNNGAAYVQRAVAHNPKHMGRQIRLASSLLSQGDIEAADQVMSTWNPPTQTTENGRRILRLERFVRSNQLDRAREYAKKLRRENPSDLHALLALAEIAQRSGKADQAINWLELARDRNRDAVEPRIILATILLNRGEAAQAITVAQEAASAHPYNANVLRLIAKASLEVGDSSGALAAATEATRLAPLQSANTLVLARAQLATNNYWEGRDTITDLLKKDSSMAILVKAIVMEDLNRGNAQQAHHLVKHLKTLKIDQSVTSELEGDLHFVENNFLAAKKSYTEAYQAKPSKLLGLKLSLSNEIPIQSSSLN